VMASAPGDCARPTPVAALLPEVPVREPCRLEHGAGSSTTTHLFCGYLGADGRFAPLARSLPRLLCVRTSERGVAIEVPGGDVQAIDERSPTGRSLETSLRCAVDEATHRRAGALSMLARLSELFFVQVLRSYMEHAELAQEGWLAGLRDPYVGAALQLVHGRPEHPWTVEALGRAVGLSRSAFGERFTRLLGQPPMRYLAAWRMHVARNLMRDPRLGLADVAARVGYESEAAFHRAFKRDRGEPPAAWRRRELPHA